MEDIKVQGVTYRSSRMRYEKRRRPPSTSMCGYPWVLSYVRACLRAKGRKGEGKISRQPPTESYSTVLFLARSTVLGSVFVSSSSIPSRFCTVMSRSFVFVSQNFPTTFNWDDIYHSRFRNIINNAIQVLKIIDLPWRFWNFSRYHVFFGLKKIAKHRSKIKFAHGEKMFAIYNYIKKFTNY